MKATGIIRRVDHLGKIVIPKELRELLVETDRDFFEVFTEKDKIILRKYEPGCTFCGDLVNSF